VRRLIPPLIGVVIVVGGLLLLLNVFSSRDTGDLATSNNGPGQLESAPGNPPSSGATDGPNLVRETDVGDPALVKALAQGNVALVYGSAKPPAGLADLREQLTGPFDPELAAAGQVAFLVHRPGTQGIVALAWKRRLTVTSPTDPALKDFIDVWVGKGEGTSR
jgi:hypothetical protein